MKKAAIILSIFLIMSGIKAFSQENSILQDGTVCPVSYTINSVEQSNIVKSLTIRDRENGFYELEIEHKDNGSEYFSFKIENIIRNGKTLTGQLAEIVLEDITTQAYYNDNAVGTITIDRKRNLTTIEIRMLHSYNRNDPPTNHKIVWKNKKK